VLLRGFLVVLHPVVAYKYFLINSVFESANKQQKVTAVSGANVGLEP
jgi:hypothetical protein